MGIDVRIKEIRKNAKLTQQKFAEQIGLKRNTIGNYEIGLIVPSDRTITDICRVFNVNEQWLRTGEGEMLREQSREDELAAYMNSLLKSEPNDIRRRIVAAISHLNTSELELLEKIALQAAEDLRISEPPVPAEHSNIVLDDEPEEEDLELRAEADDYYNQRLLEKRTKTSSASFQEKTGSGGASRNSISRAGGKHG